MKPIRSIGIIMDGNRRWAKARGLPTSEGHKAGLEPLRKLAAAFPELKEKYGLEYAIFYTFSTENWNRSGEEVAYLMSLFEVGFKEILKAVEKEKDTTRAIRVRMMGQLERFSPAVQKIMKDAEERTAKNSGGTAVFALSYGGRAEILNAVNHLVAKGEEVDEKAFAEALWTKDIPDPDLIIRTSGEQRVSGFLPWQGVYSELFFLEKHWPDFSVEELERVFSEYQERERRIGS